MDFKIKGWIFVGTLFVSATLAATDDAYVREIQRWRAERVERLVAADGWLTLVGLHFLRDGANTIGSAKENDIVLAKAPRRIGTVVVGAGGMVTFHVDAGTEGIRVNGSVVASADLRIGNGAVKPTVVTFGTMSFLVIDRGGRKALRVKDSDAERRTHFVGLDYFPIERTWRIEARWVPFEKSRQIFMTNILGQRSPALVPGKAVFERDGKIVELLAIDEGLAEPLFFVISDVTSGKETYDVARFLYVPRPKAEATTIVLDFNRAENPPCAFTPFATCPLPPKENRLPFAVNAGEKNYRGAHE